MTFLFGFLCGSVFIGLLLFWRVHCSLRRREKTLTQIAQYRDGELI